MYHYVLCIIMYVSLYMFREKLYCIILIILTILNYIFYTTCVTSNAFVTHYFFKDRFFGQNLQSIFPKIDFNKNETSIIIKLIRDERKK